jgi:DNA-binding response OmpR family regulator
MQQERDELQERIVLLSEQIEDERNQHGDVKTQLEREIVTLRNRYEQREREMDEQRASHFALDEKRAARYEAPLVIERSAPLSKVALAPAPTPDAEEDGEGAAEPVLVPEGDILLLDEPPLRDEAVAALQAAGVEVRARGVEGASDDIAKRKAGAILLNLGAGSVAWQQLRALRERVGTRDIPIFAYAMTPDAASGFSFGYADFTLWPMPPTRLIDRLRRFCPKVRRLLVASGDIEGMSKLREPLARSYISTSMALDGRQARDLANGVQPDAAILHLSPSCPDIARALTALRTGAMTREIPILFLLDKTVSPREETFFNTLVRELLRHGAFEWADLPEELTALAARSAELKKTD